MWINRSQPISVDCAAGRSAARVALLTIVEIGCCCHDLLQGAFTSDGITVSA